MLSEDDSHLREKNHIPKNLVRLFSDIITVILSFSDTTKELAARFYMVARESIGADGDEDIPITDAFQTIRETLRKSDVRSSNLSKYSPSETTYDPNTNRDSLN